MLYGMYLPPDTHYNMVLWIMHVRSDYSVVGVLHNAIIISGVSGHIHDHL